MLDGEEGGEADAFVVGEEVGGCDVEVGEYGVEIGGRGLGGVGAGDGDA